MTLEKRLLKNRRVTNRSCWEWTKSKDKGGYGVIAVEKKTKRVHRVAYELWVGPIPDNFLVLHSCDNPLCFNPEHLWVGTQLDNMNDMAAKKRDRIRGEQNGGSKLTWEQVWEIRRQYQLGVTGYKKLAKMFGVTPAAIRDIVLERKWKENPDSGPHTRFPPNPTSVKNPAQAPHL